MKDQADKLREMANNVRQQIETELRNENRRARVIAISSGKGGVGKSTLALNLSLSLSAKGKRVLLMDAYLGMSNLDIMLGALPKYNLYNLVQGNKSIEEITITGPSGLRIIPGGSGIQELANLSGMEFKRLLVALNKMDNEYDYMILDTGAGISSNVMYFLLSADDVMIITTPEPTSLTDAYGVIKSLDRNQFPGRVFLVVNRVVDESEGILVAEKLKLVCQKYLQINLIPMGYIADDEMVGEGIRQQQPFIQLYPRSKASRNIDNIAERILYSRGEESTGQEPASKGIRNFFKRIMTMAR